MQEELGLNMTAMDFRQYDSAIGRFYSVDGLSELAPNWTPYRFGYNNPVWYNDPTGLFESRKAARQYRREHDISGRIVKQDDGTFAIQDSKNSLSYSAGDDSISIEENFSGDGVVEFTIVKGNVKQSTSVGQPGALESAIPIWGSGRASIDHFQNGNYLKGTAYMALAISDVFLVKSLVVGGAKLGMSMLAKSGAGLVDDATVKGGNVVYHSIEAGVTQYVGITNNLARRAAQHLGRKGIRIEPLMQGLTRADARAVEQALIEIHGLGKNGGTLINKINSISTANPAYSSQLQRGYELLKSIGYH